MEHVIAVLGVSERRACRALGQPRSTQRYEAIPLTDEDALTADIIRLASQYGRYGYRRINAMLRYRGWRVNHKRVERIWRRAGLQGAEETTKARAAMAQRWLLRPATANAPQPRVGL